MRINNNITYQNMNLNRKNNNVKSVSNYQHTNDAVNFTGLGKLDPRNLKRLDCDTVENLYFAANKLGLPLKPVKAAINRLSNPQRNLFSVMVEKFNCDNFYKPVEKKEDPNIVLSLVDKIQFPTMSHLRFANTKHFSLTEVSECMEKLDYSPSKIKKFHMISSDLATTTEASSKDMMSILNSENSKEYLKKYSVYEPYFKRHITEPNAVKRLDEMVATGTYDAVNERKIYELEKTTKGIHMGDVVNIESLAPYSSKESNELLKLLTNKLNPSILKDKTNYSENLSEIYLTTTKDNFKARSAYLNSYMYSKGAHEYHRDEMDNITELFKRMDEEPKVMNFVKNISVPDSNIVGAGGILKVLDGVSPKKRDLYSRQIGSILISGIKDPVDKAVRFCSLQPDSLLGNIKKGIKTYVGSLTKLSSDDFSFHEQRRTIKRKYKKLNVPIADRPEIIVENPSK